MCFETSDDQIHVLTKYSNFIVEINKKPECIGRTVGSVDKNWWWLRFSIAAVAQMERTHI